MKYLLVFMLDHSLLCLLSYLGTGLIRFLTHVRVLIASSFE